MAPYSLGGLANLGELLRLQDRYGLFLWFDDTHALSVLGPHGEGYVRSAVSEVNELTVITASLQKGFGCPGGVVMLNAGADSSFISAIGGPMSWSQGSGMASLGGILAATRLHASPELREAPGRPAAQPGLLRPPGAQRPGGQPASGPGPDDR